MREVPTKTGGTFAVHAPDISDWAEILHHSDPEKGHRYAVYTPGSPEPIGWLRYITDFPRPGIITVHDLQVVAGPDYRGKGVATALLAALHADNPNHKISPGAPRPEGLKFIRHLLQVEPEVREAGALLHESVAHLAFS